MWWLGSRARWPEPKWPKSYPTLEVTHKKNKIQNFFHCNLEDLPHLVWVWTAQ